MLINNILLAVIAVALIYELIKREVMRYEFNKILGITPKKTLKRKKSSK